jgi:hypothetical protein
MTILVLRNNVTVTIDDWCCVTTADKDMQEGIDALLSLYPVKPIVNRQPWTARLIVGHYGGRIVSEPAFDPNLGDVIHGITNITG